jgi:predicted AAA+ superfamily ATPase
MRHWEFCDLNDFSEIAHKIKNDSFDFLNSKVSVDYTIHSQMLKYFNEYVVVGGMSEVVLEFCDSHDYNKVFKIQSQIVSQYKADIIKHAPKNAKTKISKLFELIPTILSKQNNKVVFSKIQNKITKIENYRTTLE